MLGLLFVFIGGACLAVIPILIFIMMTYPSLVTKKLNMKLNNQSVVVNAEKGIMGSVHEFSKEYRETVSNSYQIFQCGLKSGPKDRCLGKRSNFTSDVKWYTYEEVDQSIKVFGTGLLQLMMTGSSESAMLGIMGKNCPEWVISMLAGGFYGIPVVPLYDTFGKEALSYIVKEAELKFICCDRPSTALKIVDAVEGNEEDEYSSISLTLIVMEPSGDEFDQVKQSLVNKGHSALRFDEIMPCTRDQLCMIAYTSGSTGLPKGVMVSHGSMVTAVLQLTMLFKEMDILNQKHHHLSYLPLSHLLEQINMTTILYHGGSVGFLTDTVKDIDSDLRLYRPTVISTVPRILTRIYTEFLRHMRKTFYGLPILRYLTWSKLREQKQGIYSKGGFFDNLLFAKLRQRFGNRIQLVCSGSAPISSEVKQFARVAFSCPVIEGYGSTELCSIATMTCPGDVEFGHVGSPLPGVEVKLLDVPEMSIEVKRDGVGEIGAKIAGVNARYYKREHLNEDLHDEDGFTRMGDIGRWTERGQLQIIDRRKNMFKLSQGEYIAPEKVENVYQTSQLISFSFLDGNSLFPYAVLVAVPDFSALRSSLQKVTSPDESSDLCGLDQLSSEEMCRNDKIKKFILIELNKIGTEAGLKSFEQEIDRLHVINSHFLGDVHKRTCLCSPCLLGEDGYKRTLTGLGGRCAQDPLYKLAKAIHLTASPFTTENGLLTPTQKLARYTARQVFKSDIDRLYQQSQVSNGCQC